MWLLCNRNHENMKNDPVKRRNTFHCRVIFIPFEPGRVFLGRQAPVTPGQRRTERRGDLGAREVGSHLWLMPLVRQLIKYRKKPQDPIQVFSHTLYKTKKL